MIRAGVVVRCWPADAMVVESEMGEFVTMARICLTSPAVRPRGVWRLMPSVPLSCDMPLPDSKRMVFRSELMSVTGKLFLLAETHAEPSSLGDSTTPRNQSCSLGGLTVTRKMRPPALRRSSTLPVLLYRSTGHTSRSARGLPPMRASFSKTALLTMARMSGTEPAILANRAHRVAPNAKSDVEATARTARMMPAHRGASQCMSTDCIGES